MTKQPFTLPFPTKGMDEFWSYRQQPLLSSPDLLNVRPVASLDGRMGGGQRPGTSKAYAEVLGSGTPIRMLGQITVASLAVTDSDNFDRPNAANLGAGWTVASWSTGGTRSLVVDKLGFSMEALNHKFGANYRTTTPTYSATYDYFVQVYVRPPQHGNDVSEYLHLYLRMAATPAIATDGLDASLRIVKKNSTYFTYSGTLKCYVAGVLTSTTAFATADLAWSSLPTAFKVQVATNAITVMLGATTLCAATVSAQAGLALGIGVDRSGGDPGQYDNFLFQATKPATSSTQYRSILLASAGGLLYDEDATGVMTLVTGDAAAFSTDHTFQGVETATGFYIADYGPNRVSGADGTIGGAGHDELTATGVTDWTTYGIDPDTDVVVITDATGPLTRAYTITSVVTAKLTLASSAAGAMATVDPPPTAGGAGYTKADILDVTQGTGGQVKVTDVSSGGVVTAIKLKATGTTGYTIGTAKATTGGTGSGCTIKILTVTGDGTCSYQVARAPKKYTLQGTVAIWTATAGRGSVPVGCRLIAVYRNRLVLARPDSDPQTWFMARQGDPEDWDYGDTDAQAAVSGTDAEAGKLGDIITALIPYSDDYLIIGGLHSIWRMSGDPAEGGRIDAVSYKTGIVGACSWTFDESGNLYFLGTDGLYVLAPGGQPKNLSEQKLPRSLRDIQVDTTEVELLWSHKEKGVHIFVTPMATSAAVHWFYHLATDSFWRDQLPDAQGPTAAYSYGSAVAARRLDLIGGRDGYIRHFAQDSKNDDGTAIESYALFAPQALAGSREAVIQKLDVTLSTNSDAADWELRVGDTFEDAINATALYSGTFNSGGLQYTLRRRARGMAACLRVGNDDLDESWALEEVLGEAAVAGVRRKA